MRKKDDFRLRMQGDWGVKLAGAVLVVMAAVAVARAQDAVPAAQNSSASASPLVITLDEAIRRAEKSDPTYVTAAGASQSAAMDKGIARAGLLPNLHGLSQDVYA
ncbi:MAG: hypothetical protein ACLGSH_05525, partial [Acidobacteriota bacterium]